jgi:hypothetical protein
MGMTVKPHRGKHAKKSITLQLSQGDLAILDGFRGHLTRDAFISALLRMIDTGAVSKTPEHVKKKST